jgi:hypothetical protein
MTDYNAGKTYKNDRDSCEHDTVEEALAAGVDYNDIPEIWQSEADIQFARSLTDLAAASKNSNNQPLDFDGDDREEIAW